MSLYEFIERTKKRFLNEQMSFGTTVKVSTHELAIGVGRKVGKHVNYGSSIWEEEWDVLIILDACRYDAFNETYGDSDLFETIESRYSVAGTSNEWIKKTFNKSHLDEIQNTAYITGNLFGTLMLEDRDGPYDTFEYDGVETDVSSDDFGYYKNLGMTEAWDEERGTIYPEPLSDHAVDVYLEEEPERMIVHYMQPHYPYLGYPESRGMSRENFGSEDMSDPENPSDFHRLQYGDLTFEKHWEMYIDNLEYVVENIQDTLLKGIDAEKVVFTADHGELFGEYGMYEHPGFIPLPKLKRVPWGVTSATNEGYEPEQTEFTEVEFSELMERLQDLGYYE